MIAQRAFAKGAIFWCAVVLAGAAQSQTSGPQTMAAAGFSTNPMVTLTQGAVYDHSKGFPKGNFTSQDRSMINHFQVTGDQLTVYRWVNAKWGPPTPFKRISQDTFAGRNGDFYVIRSLNLIVYQSGQIQRAFLRDQPVPELQLQGSGGESCSEIIPGLEICVDE